MTTAAALLQRDRTSLNDAIMPGGSLLAPSHALATPTFDTLARRFADFTTMTEALDYAAKGRRGANFYSSRGELKAVLPYSELRARALRVARQLIALGVRPDDRVALVAETSPEFLGFFCGAIYAGALPTPLPLPTSFGGKEGYVEQIRNQLISAKPKVVLAPAGLYEMITAASEGLGADVTGDWDALAGVAPDLEAALPTRGLDDVAYLQYSSGSTRFPHGIMITHRSMLANCHGQGRHGVRLVDSDRGISWLPLFHDMGLVGCFLTPLTCQVSIDFLPTDEFVRRPLVWLDLISRNKDTTISYSPAFGYDLTARRAGSDVATRFDLSRWRVAGNGGDMIRPDVMQAFSDTFAPAGFRPGAFMPSYGLAETTLAITFMPPGEGIKTDLIDERLLSGQRLSPSLVDPQTSANCRAFVDCGRIIPDHEIEIRGESGAVLGDRQVGKVWVKGPSVMIGYFDDPEATSAVLGPDGWLDTGDMAYRVGEALFIVGRIKDMIIINGRNLYPQDVEWAVEQAAGLKPGDVAAFGVTEADGTERVVALVQCRTSDEDARAALQHVIKAGIQNHTGLTATVELVLPRSLPRTSSGKLSRSKARALYLSGEMATIEVAAA